MGGSGNRNNRNGGRRLSLPTPPLFLYSETFYNFVILFGILCVFGTLAWGWGGVQFIVGWWITKTTQLTPGTSVWEIWENVPNPAFLKVNFFNMENPEGIREGESPVVVEKGPYVYQVNSARKQIKRNEMKGTMVYKTKTTYVFKPHLSMGNMEEDVVTIINPFLLGVANEVSMKDPQKGDEQDKVLKVKGEKIVRTEKVKDLIFDGVSLHNFAGLDKSKFGIQEGKFAFFKQVEDTLECYTGLKNRSELGIIVNINGKPKSENEGYSSPLNSTDGLLYPPLLTSAPGEAQLSIFIPRLCRSLPWEFVKMSSLTEYKVEVATYRVPDIHGKNNGGHTVPVDLSQCFDGIPFLYTKPHLLGMSPKIRHRVEGMKPNRGIHEGMLHIYAPTGFFMQQTVKYQLNIELKQWKNTETFRRVQNGTIIPIMWIEMESSGPRHPMIITCLSWFFKLLPILRVLGMVGAVMIIFMGFFFRYRCTNELLLPPNIRREREQEEDDDGDYNDIRAAAERQLWMRKLKKVVVPEGGMDLSKSSRMEEAERTLGFIAR